MSFPLRAVHPGSAVVLACTLVLAACGGPEVRAVFATAAAFTHAEDTALEGTLQGTGTEGASLTFRAVTQPSHGTLEVQSGGGFRYSPAPDYAGEDRFTFEVDDGTATSEPAEISITVTPVNDAPVVQGQASALVTPEDTPLALSAANLVVSDVDDALETLTLEVLPGANFTWAGGVLTPAADFHGTLTLEVEVSDGEASVPAQLEVTVTPVDDAPKIAGQAHPLSTPEDTSLTLSIADVMVADVDSPGSTLSFAVLDGPGYTRLGNAVTPAADFNGDLQVMVAVANEDTQSNPFSLLVTVVPVNDAPVITAQAHPITTAEDTSFQVALTHVNVVDVDHPTSALAIQVLDGPGYTHLGNTVTPPPNFHGALTVAVTVTDGVEGSAPFSLQVTVTPVEDSPVITAQARALSTAEDTALALSLADVTVTDVDSTSFSLVVLNGTNYSHAGTTVTPAADFSGTLQVNVAASDGQTQSAPFPLQITVTPVNDPPVITAQARALSTPEDTPLTLALADVTASDVDSASLTLSVLAGTNYARTGNTVTPSANFNGTLRVNVTVSDGAAQSAPFELAVTVGSVNDAPVITAQARALSTPEDTAFTVTLADLTVVDADHPASALSIQVQGGTNYTVAGTTVTPALNFNGSLQIPVRVSDGEDSSAVFNLAVTVTPVNDLPRVVGQVALAVDEETPITLSLAHFTLEDPDNTPPQGFSLQVLAGTNYTFSGTTVTPVANYSGTLSVQITAHDGSGAGPVYPAQVTVRPVNKPPRAVADAFRTSANTELTVAAGAGVLANDSDRESSVRVTAFNATGTQGGTVQLSPDGSLVFRPRAGFVGNDTFQYTVTETVGTQTATATVSVAVVGPAIWYVDSAVATSGDGRSHAPFKQLSQAQTASGDGDILFVYRGNGTAYGNVVLKQDQALVGEAAGLVRPENPPIPPGARPVLGGGSGTAVTLAARNQVRGLDVSNVAGSGVVGTGVANVTLTGVGVNAATDGLVLNGTGSAQGRLEAVTVTTTNGRALVASGFSTLTLPDSQVTLTAVGGPALDLSSIGTLNATVRSISSSQSTSHGVRLEGVAGTFGVQQAVALTRPTTSGMLVRTSNGTFTVPRLDVQQGSRGLTVDGFNGTFTLGPSTGAAGAGGTIQNTVDEGVLLANASGITLRRLAVHATGADGLRVPDGAKVTNLTVLDSLFFQAGNASTEHALNFGRGTNTGSAQLDGTVLVQNTTLEASGGGGLFLENGGGVLTLTLDGLSVQSTGPGTAGVLVRADSSRPTSAPPQVTLTVRASNFSGVPVGANGLDIATEGGAANVTATVEDNLFHNTSGQGNNALRLSADGTGAALTAFVRRNSVRNWNGHAFLLQTGDENADLRATVEDNTIGDGSNPSVVGSAAGSGIRVLLDADPLGTSARGRVALRNNVIGKTGDSGIQVVARQGQALANNRLDVILQNNRVTAPANDAIRLAVSESTTLCAAVTGNTLTPAPGRMGLFLTQSAPAGFLVQGVGPSPTASTVQSYLAANNTANPVLASGTFQSTPACLVP